MDEERKKALATELAKDLKTEADLSDFVSELMKLTVETALGSEMEAHLGYPKHDPAGHWLRQ
jgi:putative transposase